MGYKLAGFNHLGGVEIDPKVAANYKRNLHPQLLYVEDIRQFNERQDLPSDLYDLDLLDGSPPCSTFSTAGSREDAWGKRKQFKEGQQVQTLDDLVFVYCDTIKKLMPSIEIFDGGLGTARHLKRCLEERGILSTKETAGTVRIENSLDDEKIIELSRKLLYDEN